MKKLRIISFILLICIIFNACSSAALKDDAQAEAKQEPAQVYIIPESYFRFCNTDRDKAIQTYKELGEDYCTDAKAVDGDMYVYLTETQRYNLIERNDEYIDQLLDEFKKESEDYSYKCDDSYRKLTFFYDEKIEMTKEVNGVFGAAAGYGLNQILKYNDPNWSVEIEIINCHTNKQVVKINIPNDSVKIGDYEWQQSYKS